MSSLSGALNAPAAHYRYDAENLLVCSGTASNPLWRYWKGDLVTNAIDARQELSWSYFREQRVGTLRSGTSATITLLGADHAGSVLVEADTDIRHPCYTPYGYMPSEAAEPRPAFNGELLDEATNCYLLGPGHHRPYSPTLHYFLAPDALSPFDEGGLNAYAYCAGDPINRMDPTGHFWKWIVLGVAAIAAVASLGVLAAPLITGSAALTASALGGAVINAVGAAVELGALAAEAAGSDTAASILGWIGLGITAAGVVTALPSIAAKASRRVAKRLAGASRTAKLADASTPSGGWHTGGHLQLSDGSQLSPRPPFEGREYISHMPKKRSPSNSPPVQNPPRPLLYKDLGPHAKETLEKIRTGAPTDFPGYDGIAYYNLNNYLPPSTKANRYVEYSVPNPNQAARGTHRLVLGGLNPTGPKNVYFSGDHYTTFRRVIFEPTMDPWYPR
ncbi:RHS repeat-associated core domain-containing protein [Stenotrophomonas bentonitica]